MKCPRWMAAAVFACVVGGQSLVGFGQTPPSYYSRDDASSLVRALSSDVYFSSNDHEDVSVVAPDFDSRELAIDPSCLPLCCDPCCVNDEPWHLFPQDGPFRVHGWLNGGITFNGRRTSDRFNGPVAFNDLRDEFMMNQLYTVIERELDTTWGWDIGGRVDLLYGTDYIFNQAAGLETRPDGSPRWNTHRFYGLAMPQLYGEVGYGNLSLKLGRFYTIIGYEGVMAPGHFFYSHPYTHLYGEPFTHTGGLANWTPSNNWSFYAGIVDGWDKFDPVTSRAHFLGGVEYTPDHEAYSIAFALITGDEDGSDPPIEGNLTMYSVVFSWDVNDRTQYVLQHDLGVQQLRDGGKEEWYGINQYLFYTLSDTWRAGLRAEWFRDHNGVRVEGVRDGNLTGGHAGHFYGVTAGLNYVPTNNLTFRPEVRWDWFDGVNVNPANRAPFDDNNSQFTVGMDAILIW